MQQLACNIAVFHRLRMKELFVQ